MANTTIELNGKLYDSASGLPVKGKTRPQEKQAPTVARRAGNGFIDGVRRPVGAAMKSVKRPIMMPKVVSQLPGKAHKKAKPAQKVHSRTQRAATLIRRGVKAPSQPTVSVKLPPKAAPKKHDERAKFVQKSDKISRFGSNLRQSVTMPTPIKKSVPLAAKPAPASAVKASSVKQTASASKPSQKERLIAEGLAKSQSHREPKHDNKPKRRIWRVGLPVAAVVVMLGYFVYLNIPNINMKVAAYRAGFSANLPSYNPGGFRLAGPVSYSQGQITIGYRSNTDDRNFQITQKKSNWDSESLFSNIVTKNAGYQIARDHGLTIYLYGDSSATWVNSGIWYTIEGQSQLSSTQIQKIAASM